MRTARCPYSANQRILLLGEGDFSFAAALCLLWGEAPHLVATSLDDSSTAQAKYTSLAENIETVRSAGGAVHFGVDATRPCPKSVRRAAGADGFDRVVFNFPHAGGGQKDKARNVAANQALLRGTFTAGAQLLGAKGEIHLSLKRGEPYDSWQCVAIAKMCGLRVAHCSSFEPAAFPGYAHRRTIGDEHAGAEYGASGAKTYAFSAREGHT